MLDQLRIALDAPGARVILLVCAGLAVLGFLPLARRFGWSPGWTLVTLLALAPILAFTLPPDSAVEPVGAGARLHEYVHSFLDPLAFHAQVNAPGPESERVANLLLFIPAGFCATLATRWPVRVAIAGVTLPFLIEAWQALTGARIASAGDWLHNSAGALIGIVLAAALLPLTRRPASRPAGNKAAGNKSAGNKAAGNEYDPGEAPTLDLTRH
jgi:VanZ family protein